MVEAENVTLEEPTLLQNIMTLLSHRQEEYVMKKVRQEAYKKCDIDMRAFVDCTKDKYFTIPKECKQQFNNMNKCVGQYNNSKAIYDAQLEYSKLLREYFNLFNCFA